MKKILIATLFVAACSQTKSPAPEAAKQTAVAVAAPGEPPLIPVGTKTKCVVSNEEFTVKPNTTQIVYQGKRYAFCCADCKPDFEKNPAKYAAK
jgi:YHS domain-containing protein